MSFECVICHNSTLNKYKNNPAPIFCGIDDWCCESCNNKVIVPKRISNMKQKIDDFKEPKRSTYNCEYFQ